MQIRSNIPGNVLYRLNEEYKFKCFVETGTASGDTTELAALMFDRVWTCDIEARSVETAKLRLAEYGNLEISAEPSPEFIKRIQPELTGPVLYWLDAHWCGSPVKPEKECPLLDELAAIGSMVHDGQPVVLLIDDANLMIDPPPKPHDPAQWPTLEDIQLTLNSWDTPYELDWWFGPQSVVLIVKPKREDTE